MPLDRSHVLDRFRRTRARTRALFKLVDEAAYYDRPIASRNPIVFYEGHLPAFAINTLIKKGLGQAGVDEALETIFARGIDPDTEAAAVGRGNPAWPPRTVVRDYVTAADRLLEDAIAGADLERDDHPLLQNAQALWTILEHEEMHQEALALMWHQLPHASKKKPEHYMTAPPRLAHGVRAGGHAHIPGGTTSMGTDAAHGAFAWDNERPAHRTRVPPFAIDVFGVTNADFMAFVEAGGYNESRWWRPEDFAWVQAEAVRHPSFWDRDAGRWQWRGMFESVPLPEAWPVYVTWAEAHAYAAWRGMRLPTEAEFQRAAYGTPDGHERRYPWGEALSRRPPDNFDFLRWDPDPVDAHADAASACGVHGLVGNGWEWTSTVFAPFEGFEPLPSYPEYSAACFDGDHFVMKGASPVTARELVRPGFRNWCRPRYPYVYAKFRCVKATP